MNQQPWVLLLAYHFPPENVIGSLRPYRFTKYLPEFGFRSYVISAADIRNLPGVEGQYVPDPFSNAATHNLSWQRDRFVRKLLLPGAVGISWASRAARAAHSFLEGKTPGSVVLFSTWPPLGPHLAAHRISKRHRMPWVADFRDPMAANPIHSHLGSHTHAAFRYLERRYLHSAAAAIANTDAAQLAMQQRNPAFASKVHLLWNGFDPGARLPPLPLPPRERRIYSHVGELYVGRTTQPLLQAVDALISNGRLDPTRIQIHLAGPAAADCLPPTSLLDRAQGAGWLRITPQQLPQGEAAQIAQTSDGLILLQPQSSVQVPAKLFDYLQIGRPILALLPQHSVVERLLTLSEVPHRIIHNHAPSETASRILLEFFALPSHRKPPSAWFEENFNCRTQTAVLARLFRSVLDSKTA